MIHLRYGDDDNVAAWVARVLDVDPFERFASIGIIGEEGIIAGCVYSGFVGHDVEMSIASISPYWMSRARLHMLFAYPFIQLGTARVTARVARKNKRARKMCIGLGFKHEGTLRKAYNGRQDCMVYGMLKKDCKFLGQNHG